MVTGPLAGVKVVEIGSIGPGPFAAMVLANLGADVLRLQRPGERSPLADLGAGADRIGRPTVSIDLKSQIGNEMARSLVEHADAVIEGFRPGVMERIGLGPDVLLKANPALVYGRITGYGQYGPLALHAGHDINYLAISGTLSTMAREGERPLFPLNLLADYGGGGMLLALGVVCGILEARRSGRGQVIDAAMVDGVTQLATLIYGMAEAGGWSQPGTNVLDSGAHFYDVYTTSDGGYVAVGAIEAPFYLDLLRVLDLPPEQFPQWDRTRWPEFKAEFARIFASQTRAAWVESAQNTNACLTPVLSLQEAPTHPHHVARGTFTVRDGRQLPASAPRFSEAQPVDRAQPNTDAVQALHRWGVSGKDIEALFTVGAFV